MPDCLLTFSFCLEISCLFFSSSLASFLLLLLLLLLLLTSALTSALRLPEPLQAVSLYALPILPFIPLPDLFPSPLIRCSPSPSLPPTTNTSPLGHLPPPLPRREKKGAGQGERERCREKTAGLTDDERLTVKRSKKQRGKNGYLETRMDGGEEWSRQWGLR